MRPGRTRTAGAGCHARDDAHRKERFTHEPDPSGPAATIGRRYAGDKANLIATGESSREADHTFPVSVNQMRCPSLHALPRVEETR
jgi:hypothetical protein